LLDKQLSAHAPIKFSGKPQSHSLPIANADFPHRPSIKVKHLTHLIGSDASNLRKAVGYRRCAWQRPRRKVPFTKGHVKAERGRDLVNTINTDQVETLLRSADPLYPPRRWGGGEGLFLKLRRKGFAGEGHKGRSHWVAMDYAVSSEGSGPGK
jgi:hypothetical protein